MEPYPLHRELSPLTRGTDDHGIVQDTFTGIIPADAGNGGGESMTLDIEGNYPR